jgi:hypothetical protein
MPVNLKWRDAPPQVVSQNSHLLAPIAVDAVLKVIDPATATNVDLRDIRVRAPQLFSESAQPSLDCAK